MAATSDRNVARLEFQSASVLIADLFTLVGCIERSLACVQILRLWRAGGAAEVDIVPGEHFP